MNIHCFLRGNPKRAGMLINLNIRKKFFNFNGIRLRFHSAIGAKYSYLICFGIIANDFCSWALLLQAPVYCFHI